MGELDIRLLLRLWGRQYEPAPERLDEGRVGRGVRALFSNTTGSRKSLTIL